VSVSKTNDYLLLNRIKWSKFTFLEILLNIFLFGLVFDAWNATKTLKNLL